MVVLAQQIVGDALSEGLSAESTTTVPTVEGTTTTNVTSSKSAVTTSRSGGQYQHKSHVQPPWPANTAEVATKGAPAVAEAPFADEAWATRWEGNWLSEKDMRALRRGVEWYFSDTNLSMDQALHHRISQHLPEGWLCCSELMRLEPIRQLGATPELLLRCLRWSHLETKVTLTADELPIAVGTPAEFGKRGVFIRRRQPLPPLLARDRLHLQGEAAVAEPWAAVSDPTQIVLVDRHQTMKRLRDLWTVQRQLGLNETGDDVTVFRERLLPNVRPENRPLNGRPVVFAVGYERVVYGDHGAYIEFTDAQIRWKSWPHFFSKAKFNSYFDEYYTKASHSIWEDKWRMWDANATKGVLMLYAQNRSVADRPWAPGAGTDPHAGRPAGYADYRPGYFYAAADCFLVLPPDKQAAM